MNSIKRQSSKHLVKLRTNIKAGHMVLQNNNKEEASKRPKSQNGQSSYRLNKITHGLQKHRHSSLY